MKLKLLVLTVLCTALHTASHAAAYKCTDTEGKVSFSDTPCPITVKKEEKVLGRGAGSNPLNEEEKREFRKGVMIACTEPRNVCECWGEQLAESITFEEMRQTMANNNRPAGSVLEKSKKALRACESRL